MIRLTKTQMTARAWAAGFFDGEGCAIAPTHPNNNKIPYPMICVGQTEERSLYKFKSAVGGVGVVRGPFRSKKYKPHYKDQYRYSANGIPQCLQITKALMPYLCNIGRKKLLKMWEKVLAGRKELSTIPPDYRVKTKEIAKIVKRLTTYLRNGDY